MYIRIAPVDCQAFDEIRIVTVPRYKTSAYSGDEWRYSARTELLYKGSVIASKYYHDVSSATRDLDSFVQRSAVNQKKIDILENGGFCDQEGCSEKATTIYRVKKRFCRRGKEHDNFRPDGAPPDVRQFCASHSRRGNCSLEDSDANYEVLEGAGPQTPPDSALSPSVFGGFVTADCIPNIDGDAANDDNSE